jgi:hypothetical protein
MQSVCTAPGKRSPSLFLPGEDRQREIVAGEGLVDPQHLLGLCARLGLRLVSGVAFLPENSAVRRKTRGRISQRTTFAHWLIKIGRSR